MRRGRVRRRAGLCLAVGSVVLTSCGTARESTDGGREGQASCVAPYLDTHSPGHPGTSARSAPRTVEPGGTLDVYGHWYTTTCNDTGASAPLAPMPDVHLTVTLPDGRAVRLGPFTPAGRDMGFHAHVVIPQDTPPGSAKISDDDRVHSTWGAYEFLVG